MAKDALGNDVFASKWVASHKAGDRSLVQGLKVRAALNSTGRGGLGGGSAGLRCLPAKCVATYTMISHSFGATRHLRGVRPAFLNPKAGVGGCVLGDD